MNTVAYSAGRVCFPTQRDARLADEREMPVWPRDDWWVGKRTIADWTPASRIDGVPLSVYSLRLYYGLPT